LLDLVDLLDLLDLLDLPGVRADFFAGLGDFLDDLDLAEDLGI
jgi:hypothetical protein